MSYCTSIVHRAYKSHAWTSGGKEYLQSIEIFYNLRPKWPPDTHKDMSVISLVFDVMQAAEDLWMASRAVDLKSGISMKFWCDGAAGDLWPAGR